MFKCGKYSPEFKREAIALTLQPGVSCRQIAGRLVLILTCISMVRRSG
ncbi:Transposase [Marinobacter litoralis]|uniref:Transposase n=1 Tax=Marinobacter litoralis TaxID=187981 RepID=A0A3M2RKN2_9GAMM|nr:Transposase [Marinobacter litoralis]